MMASLRIRPISSFVMSRCNLTFKQTIPMYTYASG